MTIVLGGDGQNLDDCMSNHCNECNIPVESSMFHVNIDFSTETLPKCVSQAGHQLTATIDFTEGPL